MNLLEKSIITGIVKRMHKDGKTLQEIADLFGLEPAAVVLQEINTHLNRIETAEKYEGATDDGPNADFWKYLSIMKQPKKESH